MEKDTSFFFFRNAKRPSKYVFSSDDDDDDVDRSQERPAKKGEYVTKS